MCSEFHLDIGTVESNQCCRDLVRIGPHPERPRLVARILCTATRSDLMVVRVAGTPIQRRVGVIESVVA